MLNEKELAFDSDEKVNSKDTKVYPANAAVIEDLYEDGTVDPVYQAKARLLNAAIQEIGMGRYQVCSSA